jgi:hypothetical protein
LPALPYFNFRSGEHVNFYFAGYAQSQDAPAGFVIAIPSIAAKPGWAFSAKAFNEFRSELHNTTTWRYSGDSELILANARYDAKRDSAFVDFSSALSITLEKLEYDGALSNAGMLFERILAYAETCKADDPTWGFSDAMGMNVAGSALKNLFISILPAPLRKNAAVAFNFTSKDMGK